MHPLMKHGREKNGSHTAWNDQSQSGCHFQNMFWDSCVFNAIGLGGAAKERSEHGDSGGLWLVFYSSESKQATESSLARLAMTREWLLRFPAWGGKMRCSSRWRHSAEKVGVETKMCLFMPTGVLTLLRAAFAFCQERELKGHSQDVETSTPFCLSSTFCLALPPPPPPPLGQQL